MSLVNKMLRDLDARHVGDGERAALPAAVTPLAAHQEADRTLPRLALAGLLALALGLAAWYGLRKLDSEPKPQTIAAKAVPSPAPAPEPAPAPAIAVATDPAVPVPAPTAALPALRLADALTGAPALKEPAATPRKTEQAVAAPAPPIAREKPARAEVPSAPAVALPRIPPAAIEPKIEKQTRQPSAAERAETEYRRGLAAQRQGSPDDAIGMYRAALLAQPEHAAARQALAALLIDARSFDDAEELLRAGTELAPVRLASTLALARLKVERNQAAAALDLLLKHAAAGERSAEFQGFAGALLNRAGRAAEAVEHYQAATRLAPAEGRWWAGLGIALDAAGKAPEAREAYQKARALPGLPVDLAQHVEQRLR